MYLTYKFRLYPNEEQDEKLSETLELCRQIYNHFLSQLNNKENIPNKYELQGQLPKLKTEKPELKKVHSKVLHMVLYQLYSSLKALARLKKNGKKVGRLRRKGKGWYKTFIYNQSGYKIIQKEKRLDLLYLSKIGNVPFRLHREIRGNIKQIIIKKYSSGKWFALISIEKDIEKQPENMEKRVGIDVGIKHFLTDSDGRQIENPKFYEKALKRIKREQKKLSKKRQGSKNRERQQIKLARQYERLTNQKADFHHKLSSFYINNYDLVAIEDLIIRNVVRSRNLGKRILDASWDKFFQMLSYKAENAGKVIVKVSPKGASQEYRFGKLDRDYNASLNILHKGYKN